MCNEFRVSETARRKYSRNITKYKVESQRNNRISEKIFYTQSLNGSCPLFQSILLFVPTLTFKDSRPYFEIKIVPGPYIRMTKQTREHKTKQSPGKKEKNIHKKQMNNLQHKKKYLRK